MISQIQTQPNNVQFGEIPGKGSIPDFIKQALGSGYSIHHTIEGKPFLTPNTHDISISDKGGKIFIGITGCNFRIGVDLEEFDPKINITAFRRYAFSKNENILVDSFCKENSVPEQYSVQLFWSLKEAFFKSFGSKIIPNSVHIDGISGTRATLSMNQEVRQILQSRSLELCQASFVIKKPYIYSLVLLRGALPANYETF